MDKGIVLTEIDEIFDHREVLLQALRDLESCIGSTIRSGEQVEYMQEIERDFLLRAIERQPDLIYGYYKEFRYAAIEDAETLRLVLELFREKGYEVSVEMFTAPTGDVPDSETVKNEKGEYVIAPGFVLKKSEVHGGGE